MQVELHHVALQLDSEVVHLSDDVKHLNDGTWGQSWVLLVTLDCESLTRACLTVSKDANVVAINSALNKSLTVLKDLVLGRLLVKDSIKVVVLCSGTVTNCQRHLIGLLIALDCLFRICEFSLGEGSDTAVHSDLALEIFKFVQKLLTLSLLLLVLIRKLIELCRALLQL